MTYQLWNLRTGNAIAEYESESQTLALMRRTTGELGRSTAPDWALVAVADDGGMFTIAEGDCLVERARRECGS